MAFSGHAGWRTLFLFSVGLDNVKLAVSFERSIDKIVEPTFGHFPVFSLCKPFGRRPTSGLQPCSVVVFVGKSDARLLALSATPQNNGNFVLTPYSLQPFIAFVGVAHDIALIAQLNAKQLTIRR
jgi:hypothetical protein